MSQGYRRLVPVVLFIISLFSPAFVNAEQDWRLSKNVYIVFDASGSMFQRKCAGGKLKIDVAKSALKTFLERVPSGTHLGMYVFDETGPHEAVPLGEVDRSRFQRTIRSIRAGGKTPLNQAIDAAKNALNSQRKKQLDYGEYMLLIVTDGEADNPTALPSHVKEVIEAGIVIQVIGFCLEGEHSLKSMVHRYREANSPEELQSALEAVLGEAESYSDRDRFESGN